MNVALDPRSQDFVEAVARDGRYASAEDVVREGLRLVEAREAKLNALRETIASAIAEGGEHGSDDVKAAAKAALAERRKQKAPAAD